MKSKATLMFDKDAFQGIGWRAHEQISERYDVVVQPPLMQEIAGDYTVGKANSRNVGPAEHVITLIRKLGGRYVFGSPASALCARELRGESIRLDGTPYIQRHIDAFDGQGNPFALEAREPEGALPVYERWARHVVLGEAPLVAKGIGPDIEFSTAGVLAEARPLLDRLADCPSNEELVSRCRALLSEIENARALIRCVADQSTPARNPARMKLRLDAQAEWRKRGRPAFSTYPYAAHCTLVALIYFGGIRVAGKAREDHDRGDLEHLKHLPFVDVFVSDDKLVREIGRHLVRADQRMMTKKVLLDSLGTPEVAATG
jgi:hypothetical protein